jgi:DNA-binding response OmpR family regulator
VIALTRISGTHRIDVSPMEVELLELFLRHSTPVLARGLIYERGHA